MLHLQLQCYPLSTKYKWIIYELRFKCLRIVLCILHKYGVSHRGLHRAISSVLMKIIKFFFFYVHPWVIWVNWAYFLKMLNVQLNCHSLLNFYNVSSFQKISVLFTQF